MSMKQEILEILIGKYLDGEITPSEQQILQKELERNPKAKDMLEQLRDLHERTCQAVASEVNGAGKEAGEIFEQAWQRCAKTPLRRIPKIHGRLRFAAGLAAGLIIGLMLHFALTFLSATQNESIPTDVIVKNTSNGTGEFTIPQQQMDLDGNTLRNVDWYSFTDNQGNQWLIEGLRENIIQPAAFYGDL